VIIWEYTGPWAEKKLGRTGLHARE